VVINAGLETIGLQAKKCTRSKRTMEASAQILLAQHPAVLILFSALYV
jgi:hypothetical protein